jgi:hypothetical protein
MPSQSATVTAPAGAASASVSSGKRQPGWTHWVLPSFTDIFFLVLLGILAFSPASNALLGDADTGWHIRNGESILATRSVPHTDPFSYTRAGEPWYAWEWLYDATIAAVHHFAGLNGVVLFTAVIMAATFALLFRFLLRRSGSFVVAVAFTLLTAAAAQVHMLARPHVVSWLFTLLWLEALYRFEEGSRRALLWLPVLMLVWVNVHGGFVLGLVLLAIFGCARLWQWLATRDAEHRKQASYLAIAFCACVAVTFLTPYGYKLHVHVYEYLSNKFLMDSISEFMSPNFHDSIDRYFEWFLLLPVLALALEHERATATDLLLLLFSAHSALYAARSIPTSVMTMSMAMAPMWAAVLSRPGRLGRGAGALESVREAINDISANMGSMEKQFRGHAVAVLALAASAAIAVHGGRLMSAQMMSAHFNEKVFPVKAVQFLEAQGIHDHLFNSDDWSGYLIYKLYPGTKLYFDDRHDFYGEAFVREVLRIKNAGWNWQQLLSKYQVQWVLIGADSPLATALKQSDQWRLKYDDGVAVVFARRAP